MAPNTGTPASTSRRRTHSSPRAVALLHQAQAGSGDAFAELYRGYRDLVTRYVWVRAWDPQAVDDLVHDTFTDALANLASADDDVVAWLLRLAACACNRHDWASRRHLRAAYELRVRPFAAPAPAPDPQRVDLLATLIAAAPLTDDQRHALRLRLAGYPRDLAAAEMGRTRSAVKCLEGEALRRLRSIADGAL